MDMLRLARNTRQDTADAADDELHLDARTGCFGQLVNDLALGDGVCFDADVAVSSKRNLPVNILQQHVFDAEGRNAELPVPSIQLVNKHVAEKRRRVLANRGGGGHKTQVCIHGVRLFVVVAGSDLCDIAGFVMAAKRNETDFAVAFEVLCAIDHLTAGFFEHF